MTQQTQDRETFELTPAQTLDVVLHNTPQEQLFTANGRPSIIPAEIFELYGCPHALIGAVGHTMRLLADSFEPVDDQSRAQHAIFVQIADEATALADRLEVVAKEFDKNYPS